MVVVVGGSAEFRARCRDAAEAIPAILQEVDAETASLAVDVWGPTAVVTTDQVLSTAPPTMHLVLGSMRGRLLRLPNEGLRTRDLEVRMRLAIYEAEMAAL